MFDRKHTAGGFLFAIALGALLLGWPRASAARADPDGVSTTCCPVIELHQYTLEPLKRTAMFQLYDDHFIKSQEAAGITPIGQFGFADDPNAFFWLRGFAGMNARPGDLNAFYHGPAWLKYRRQAGALFLDTDDILLLQPARPGSGFALSLLAPSPVKRSDPGGVLVFTMYYLDSYTSAQFDRLFESSIRPVVQSHGAKVLATFVSFHGPNNFPKLPVRSADVFIWFACYSSDQAYRRYEDALEGDPRWWRIQGNLALAHMYVPAEIHRLVPSQGSALRCARG